MFDSAPPAAYQCPQCQCHDVLPMHTVTRPRAGKPWKQVPIGMLVQCARCRVEYVITVQGVYRTAWGGLPSTGASAPAAKAAAQSILTQLVGDEAMPSFRGE